MELNNNNILNYLSEKKIIIPSNSSDLVVVGSIYTKKDDELLKLHSVVGTMEVNGEKKYWLHLDERKYFNNDFMNGKKFSVYFQNKYAAEFNRLQIDGQYDLVVNFPNTEQGQNFYVYFTGHLIWKKVLSIDEFKQKYYVAEYDYYKQIEQKYEKSIVLLRNENGLFFISKSNIEENLSKPYFTGFDSFYDAVENDYVHRVYVDENELETVIKIFIGSGYRVAIGEPIEKENIEIDQLKDSLLSREEVNDSNEGKEMMEVEQKIDSPLISPQPQQLIFDFDSIEPLKKDESIELYNNENLEKNVKRFNAGARYKDNLNAIDCLIKLVEEDRQATNDERKILSKFIGYGGLKEILLNPDNAWKSSLEKYKSIVRNTIDSLNKLESVLELDTPYSLLQTIRMSVTTSFYTPNHVIKGIYAVLQEKGFNYGRILEPSAGTGKFISLMPDAMKSQSEIDAVEIDPVAFLINKALIEDVNIKTYLTGFEKYDSENPYDLIISNIPFGSERVSDTSLNEKEKNLNTTIHNYYFLKSIKLLKENGLIAFVTSKGLLDSSGNQAIREYINENCNLVGAVRFPDNLFSFDSNTEVVTDLIVFQKSGIKNNIDFTKSIEIQVGDNIVPVNEYFINHSQNVLGDMIEGGLYNNNSYTVKDTNRNWLHQFSETLNPEIISNQKFQTKVKKIEVENLNDIGFLEAEKNTQDGRLTVVNNHLYLKDEGKLIPFSIRGEKVITKFKDFLRLKSAYFDLIDSEYKDDPSDIIEKKREYLNAEHFNFTHAWCDDYNLRDGLKRIVKHDVDALNLYYSVDEKGIKQKIYHERMVNPVVEIKNVDTIKDAVYASLFQYGEVNLDYVGDLLKLNEDDIILNGIGEIFYDVQKNNFVSAEEYLSGNVRVKLDAVIKAINENSALSEKYLLEKNKLELEKVQPKDLTRAEIKIVCGARWVPEKYYRQFVSEMVDREVDVRYLKSSDEFVIDEIFWANSFSHKGTSANEIFMHAFHNTYKEVKFKNADGKYEKDFDATYKVGKKIDEAKIAFEEWIWKDVAREEDLVKIYNKQFNNIVLRKYTSSNYNFPGLQSITPYDYQSEAVNMILYNNGGLVDHKVGRGKTLVMAIASQELIRRGLSKKNCIVGIKSTIPQLVEKYLEVYPNAKILFPQPSDFQKGNRKKFLAKVANGDWDCVIMSHENLNKIPNELKFQKQMLSEIISSVQSQIDDLERDGASKKAIGQANKALKKYNERFEAINSKINNNKDDVLTFQKLGIDHLFVDESHQFKNLTYVSRLRNVAGLNTQNGSQRAMNLKILIRSLNEKYNGNKGVTFLSGTPISNSISEMYNLLSYLNEDYLVSNNFTSFDSWLLNFGNITNKLEPTVTGNYKFRRRLAEYINVPELAYVYSTFSHIADDTNTKIDQPEMKGGSYIPVMVDLDENQDAFRNNLLMFTNPKHTGFLKPELIGKDYLTDGQKDAYMLLATGLSAKMSIDMRLIDPNAPYNPNGKIGELVKNANEFYSSYNDVKATQVVFCDIGTPKRIEKVGELIYDYMLDDEGITIDDLNEFIFTQGEKTPFHLIKTNLLNYFNLDGMKQVDEYIDEIKKSASSFNLYSEIKFRLIESGIPEDEIAFVHDYSTDAQRNDFFKKVNSGEIRIILGSTQKLGVGVNVQEKLLALHHIDVPYRPSDMEQRNGRGIRQKNILAKQFGNEVAVFNYCTKKTVDAYKYKLLAIKQNFITQIKSGYQSNRIVREEDEGSTMEFAKLNAILTGNDDVLLLEEATSSLSELIRKKDMVLQDVHNAERKASKLEETIPINKENIAKVMLDKVAFDKMFFENKDFKIYSINNVNCTDLEMVKETIDPFIKNLKDELNIDNTSKRLFEINGCTITVDFQAGFFRDENDTYTCKIYTPNDRAYQFNFSHIPGVFLNNLEKCILKTEKILETQREVLNNNESNLKFYNAEMGKKFDGQDKIEEYKNQIEIISQRLADSPPLIGDNIYKFSWQKGDDDIENKVSIKLK